MKNIKHIACVALLAPMLASCVTTTKTAKTANFDASTYSATVADLEVADHRVSVTLNPVPDDVRRGGMTNIKKTVEAMALDQNGNADVLVNPEFTYTVKRGFLSSKVTSMTVTGRPAFYKNFRSLNDSVWSNPTFRGVAVKSSSPFHRGVRGGGSKMKLSGGSDNGYSATDGKTRKGIGGSLEFAGAYDFDTETITPSGALTIGYYILPQIFVGVGGGYEHNIDKDIAFVPVFGNLRLYATKKSSSPYIDFRMGSSTETNDSKWKGGTYFSAGIGYAFGGFDLCVAYTNQKAELEYRDYYYSHDKKSFNQLGLRLGFRF